MGTVEIRFFTRVLSLDLKISHLTVFAVAVAVVDNAEVAITAEFVEAINCSNSNYLTAAVVEAEVVVVIAIVVVAVVVVVVVVDDDDDDDVAGH